MTVVSDFRPSWASPVTETLGRQLKKKSMTLGDLSAALQVEESRLVGCLEGVEDMTEDFADQLSSILGGEARFWLSRHERYRGQREWLAAQQLLKAVDFTSTPWLREARITVGDHIEIDAKSLLGGDLVSRLAAPHLSLLSEVRLRTSSSFPTNLDALRVWMLRCESVAPKVDQGSDLKALRAAVPTLLSFSRIPRVEVALVRLERLLSDLGIALAVVQAPSGCPVSGATWIAREGQRVVALSGRFLADDHLFFTLMHELAHVLHHGSDGAIVDELESGTDDPGDHVEEQADAQASQWILNGLEYSFNTRKPTSRQLILMAADLGISPGVLVGQLQRTGVLEFHERNSLKRRLVWEGVSLQSRRRR